MACGESLICFWRIDSIDHLRLHKMDQQGASCQNKSGDKVSGRIKSSERTAEKPRMVNRYKIFL